MDLSSIVVAPYQYHFHVFVNNAILNGVENRPVNAFFIQITVRNMTSLHYVSRQTDMWAFHCNLNEDPHFTKNLTLSANNVLCDLSTSFKEVAMVLTEAAIPASKHACIVEKLNFTAMAVARRFGNLEDKTTPLVVDISKSHFQIIEDPFRSNFEEHVNNQWVVADTDGFEEFDYNDEEEKNEINDELTRLSIDNEEGDHKSSPATEISIAALEKVKSTEKGECAICLGDMEVNEMVTRMPCDHKFHGGCIVQWLGKGHVCPLCRFEMPVAATATAMDGRSAA